MPQPLGGQAVIEGVMMKGSKYYSIAVRKPDGKIKVKVSRFRSLTKKYKILGLPVIRGVVIFAEMMVLGIRALTYSGDQQEGNKEDIGMWAIGLTLLAAFAFSLFIFKFVPLWLTKLMVSRQIIGDNRIIFNLIDGLLRISFFVLYIVIISFMADVKRLFEYHGAEHKAVACFEARKALTIKNIRRFSTKHPRCGTSFIMFVLILFILVFSFIPVDLPTYLIFLIRLPLLLPIAGLAYELIRIAGNFRALSYPGLLIQSLTTREPDESQIEVSMAALNALLKKESKV